MSKKSSNSKRTVWIFTVVFALLVKIVAISCLMVYLIDQSLQGGRSQSQNTSRLDQQTEEDFIDVVAGIGDDVVMNCAPLSCDPRCISEWYEGNYTCELGISFGPVDYRRQRPTKSKHKPKLLSSRKLMQVAGLSDINRMFAVELNPLLIPRVSGTTGNENARRHIIQRLETIGGWEIEQDDFADNTPYGSKNFVNIIATYNSTAERRLVLACHYDSKYFPARKVDGKEFIGATDSAVPCAMLLDLAYSLDEILTSSSLEMVTLQLLFFDGEEAFKQWTATDSLYGSRHLAAKWQNIPYTPKGQKTGNEYNQLHRIDMLVLLDLIGVRNPTFMNHFPSKTGKWFQHMQKVENRLSIAGLLQSHGDQYFARSSRGYGGIEDDHIPFLQRGVSCFHVIATPFPYVWHRMNDNRNALHKPTIHNLNKMFQVFVVEYLHLRKSVRKRM